MQELNFDVKKLNYKDRIGNLNISASSIVKSNKFFPTYNFENKNFIFKPLSKTKPLTTCMFSYAEVVWSYLINKYFCYAPQYQLAICQGYENNEEKYYDYGCLVENVLKEDQHLINLYEYFRDNPNKNVNINEYINYCMLFYDYTNILKAKIFKDNKQLANKLALQILLSILSGNQNYHYENIAFICDNNNNIIDLAPPIDHEFSTYLLFADDIESNKKYYLDFLEEINNPTKTIRKNIEYIKENHQQVVDDFLTEINNLKNELPNIVFEDYGFIHKGNSFGYMIGKSRYKENDEEKAFLYEIMFPPKNIDLIQINEIFIKETNETIEILINVLKNK